MRTSRRPDWSGLTAVCMASGPSLCAEDVELVRLERATRQLPAIVTNATFRAAPWADVLFGFDARFWNHYIAEVRSSGFAGRLCSFSQIAARHGVEPLSGSAWFRGFGNSGVCAVAYAIGARARRVILLGFDCARGPGGAMHWHPDHAAPLSNGLSIKRWPKQFERLLPAAKQAGCEIVNASRQTALTCFRRAELAELLAAR